MKTYPLNISSPDGCQFAGEAAMITLRGADGDLAVMAGHVPFITSVQPCDVRVTLPDNSVRTGEMQGGLLSVKADSVTLLGSFRWKEA